VIVITTPTGQIGRQLGLGNMIDSGEQLGSSPANRTKPPGRGPLTRVGPGAESCRHPGPTIEAPCVRR